ncbi:ABC transporter permease subunit [Lacisediminihabitans sp. FW035]
MTTTTTYTAHGSGLSFRGLLVSEWIKLTSLRSTLWCYGIILLINLGLTLLLSSPFQPQGDATSSLNQAFWVQSATIGTSFSQLVIAVLGALVITGEYGTGMIRSTFAAAPRRTPAILAKAAVFAATTFVISLVSLGTNAFVAAAILRGKGVELDLADTQAWLAVVGAAGFMALVGVMALGLGTIIRNSAGGISAAIGLLFVAPIIVQIFVGTTRSVWAANLLQVLPSTAGQRMSTYAAEALPRVKDIIVLDPGQGLLVLIAWVVVFAAIALTLLKRRDA